MTETQKPDSQTLIETMADLAMRFADLVRLAHDVRVSDEFIGNVFRSIVGRAVNGGDHRQPVLKLRPCCLSAKQHNRAR